MRELYGQNWYKPMEIAKLGLIRGGKRDEATVWGNYRYVLRLIKIGRLRAKNYSAGKRAYYLVPESEIARYHDTVSKIKKANSRKGKL